MRKHITAFYLETLLLITVFVGIILVLTGIFGQARAESAQARHLTESVTLAESAAEAVAAAEDVDALTNLLGEIGRVQQDGETYIVHCGDYQLAVTWSPAGELVASSITVLWRDTEIYSLETARYVGEAAG